jgi:hypothetical protein
MVVSSRATSSIASLRKAIEARIDHRSVSPEFVSTVDHVLTMYIRRLLQSLVTVSKHRAGMTDNPNREKSIRTTDLENWLLFKEDCATYFTKHNVNTGTPIPPPPVFNEKEYSAHAREEEAKLLLTAQSVRQISLRDLIPLILSESPAMTCPSGLKQRILDRVCFEEVCTDYRSRGSGVD